MFRESEAPLGVSLSACCLSKRFDPIDQDVAKCDLSVEQTRRFAR
jgi:hypothetical protein